MSTGEKQIEVKNLQVREYRPGDQPAVVFLYTEGLLAGQITANDTGADIENIHEAYLAEPHSGFWVAQVEGQVVGMIGVALDREHTAEIRRLRVHKSWQHTAIGAKLIERALEHCARHGYLKVVFDTRFEKNAALQMFDRFGFQHTRTRASHGKDLLEFYLDLYRQTNVKKEHRPKP